MRYLRHLLVLLLAIALITTATTLILGQTLLHADYLQREATKAHTFTALQAAASTQLAESQEDLTAAQLASVSQALPPDFLQDKVGGVLTQFENHYLHGGPAPTIDLSDVIARLRAAGVEVKEGSIPATVTVPDEKVPLTPAFQTYRQINWVGPLSVLVLALALGLLCWKSGDYRPLARSVAYAGALLSVFAGLFAFVPTLLGRFIHVSGQAAVFASIGRDFASQLARDLVFWFAVPGLILLAIGIGVWLFLHFEEDRPRLKSIRHKAPQAA